MYEQFDRIPMKLFPIKVCALDKSLSKQSRAKLSSHSKYYISKIAIKDPKEILSCMMNSEP